MIPRASSAVSERRRMRVVDKIVQKCVMGLENAGYSISDAEVEHLEKELSELFSSPSASSQSQLQRPASASSVIPPAAGSSSTAAVGTVAQCAVDAVVEKFNKEIKSSQQRSSVAQAAEAAAEVDNNQRHQQQMQRRPETPGRPPLRGGPAASPLSPTFERQRAVSVAEVASSATSPVSVVRMLRSTPSPTHLQTRASLDALLGKIGPVPESKRLRKMIRDTDEFRTVQDAIRLQAVEDERKKLKIKEAAAKLRVDLDAQVKEKQLRREIESVEQLQLRLRIEDDQRAAAEKEQTSQRRQRELLEQQKVQNLVLLREFRERTQHERDMERQRCDSELANIRDQLKEDAAGKLTLKVERAAALSRQMEELRAREEEERRERQRQLRESAAYQRESDAYFQHLEESRSAARDRVMSRVDHRVVLSEKQSRVIAVTPSLDDQKASWLSVKYEKESGDLLKRAETREKLQTQRQKLSQQQVQSALLLQMERKKLLAEQAAEEDRKYASGIQYSLAMQELVDDVKKQKVLAEREEWLMLIDAQQKLRQFNETKEIETNLAHPAQN